MFTDLETNLKSRERNVKLGRCNAVVGDNRAGKTAILESVRLVVDGKLPGSRFAKDLKRFGNGSRLGVSMWGPEQKLSIAATDKVAAFNTDYKIQWQTLPSMRELLDCSNQKTLSTILERWAPTDAFNIQEILKVHSMDIATEADWATMLPAEQLEKVGSLMRANSSEQSGLKKAKEYLQGSGIAAGAELADNHFAKAAKDVIKFLQTQIDTLQIREAELLILSGAIQEASTETLKKIALQVTQEVNKYMPVGFKAALEIDVRSIGWSVVDTIGDNRGRYVMSGAEKSALALGLARAWLTSEKKTIALFDDEDIGVFHSSPVNLVNFLKAVEGESRFEQVFVAGLREAEVPTGWNVIRV